MREASVARYQGCATALGVSRSIDRERRMKRHRWKDRFIGRHLLQRIVDVNKVRTLIWCRRKSLKNPCSPMDPRVAHELRKLERRIRLGRISEGPHVVGRRVPITQREFERPL